MAFAHIILSALLVSFAAAPVSIGQASREILMRLKSDITWAFFILRLH